MQFLNFIHKSFISRERLKRIHKIGVIKTRKYFIRQTRREFARNKFLKKSFWRLTKGMNVFGKQIVASHLARQNIYVWFHGHFERQRRRLWLRRRGRARGKRGLRAFRRARYSKLKYLRYYVGNPIFSMVRYSDNKLTVENTITDDIYREYDPFLQDRYEDLIEEPFNQSRIFKVLFSESTYNKYYDYKYSVYRALKRQQSFSFNFVFSFFMQSRRMSAVFRSSVGAKTLFKGVFYGEAFSLSHRRKKHNVMLFKGQKVLFKRKRRKIVDFLDVTKRRLVWLFARKWHAIYWSYIKIFPIVNLFRFFELENITYNFVSIRNSMWYYRWVNFRVTVLYYHTKRVFKRFNRKKWKRAISKLILKVYSKMRIMRYYLRILILFHLHIIYNTLSTFDKSVDYKFRLRIDYASLKSAFIPNYAKLFGLIIVTHNIDYKFSNAEEEIIEKFVKISSLSPLFLSLNRLESRFTVKKIIEKEI